MKYVDSVWEKRNLNVDSCQIYIDSADDIDGVIETINNSNKEYVEAYVGMGQIQHIWELEKQGFRFVETTIDISAMKSDISVPSRYIRFADSIDYAKSTEEDINKILADVKTGNMFITDKVSYNPRFGSKAAGNRYYFWMNDLLSGSSECFSVRYKGNLVGFEVVKFEDDVCELQIGGILSSVKIPGAGVFISIGRKKYIDSHSIRKVKTRVSSNNISVLRLHEETGFKVDSMSYLFVRN